MCLLPGRVAARPSRVCVAWRRASAGGAPQLQASRATDSSEFRGGEGGAHRNMARGAAGNLAPLHMPYRADAGNTHLGMRPAEVVTSGHKSELDADSSSSLSSPRFGSGPENLRSSARGPEPSVDIMAVRAHFAAALQADRELVKYTRHESDRLHAQLCEALDSRERFEHEVRQSINESKRLVRVRDGLQHQVLEAKRQLANLCTERAAARRACSSPSQREQQSSQDELAMLQQTLREETELLQEFAHGNEYLKQACRHIDEDMADLDRNRHAVFEQALTERQHSKSESNHRSGMVEDLNRLRSQEPRGDVSTAR